MVVHQHRKEYLKMVSETKKRIQVSLLTSTLDMLEADFEKSGLTKSNIIELALQEYFRMKGNELQ